MLEIALEITLCLFIAALIGFILGFIVAKATKKKGENKNTPKDSKNRTNKTVANVVTTVQEKSIAEDIDTLIQTVSEKETPQDADIPASDVIQQTAEALNNLDTIEDKVAQEPVIFDAPKDNQKDALTQIKGIGPKIEEQLNTAGIFRFEQIANWDEENIKWLEKHTTFAHRVKKDLWINQAKALLS